MLAQPTTKSDLHLQPLDRLLTRDLTGHLCLRIRGRVLWQHSTNHQNVPYASGGIHIYAVAMRFLHLSSIGARLRYLASNFTSQGLDEPGQSCSDSRIRSAVSICVQSQRRRSQWRRVLGSASRSITERRPPRKSFSRFISTRMLHICDMHNAVHYEILFLIFMHSQG